MKRRKKIRSPRGLRRARFLTWLVSSCLLLTLMACGQLEVPRESDSPSGVIQSSSQKDAGGMTPASSGEESITFPLSYSYQANGTGVRELKSGALNCIITDAYLVDRLDGLPDTGGFLDDTAVDIEEEGGEGELFMYSELIDEDGQLFPGVYLLRVDITVASQDAVSYTRQDRNEVGKPLGQFDDPYLFRGDNLVYLLDLRPELSGGCNCYMLNYFSGMFQRPEHDLVFRLEPGESIDLTVAFVVYDDQQGGYVNLDTLYLSTTGYGTSDPKDTLGHLVFSGEEARSS